MSETTSVAEALLPWWATPGSLNAGESAELARRRAGKVEITDTTGKKMPLADAAVSVGKRALAYAQAHAPAVAERAMQTLQAGSPSRTVSQLVDSKNPATQQAVVKTLLDSGLSARDFIEGAQLTAAEARQYAQLVAAYQVAQTQVVDAHQASVGSSTGDPALDRMVLNMEIEDACRTLGVSSDDLAKLIRVLHVVKSQDIEKFQLSRKVQRQPYI